MFSQYTLVAPKQNESKQKKFTVYESGQQAMAHLIRRTTIPECINESIAYVLGIHQSILDCTGISCSIDDFTISIALGNRQSDFFIVKNRNHQSDFFIVKNRNRQSDFFIVKNLSKDCKELNFFRQLVSYCN